MTYLTYAVFREADRPGRLSVAGPDGAAETSATPMRSAGFNPQVPDRRDVMTRIRRIGILWAVVALAVAAQGPTGDAATDPLPRVLLIGDSICGGYQQGVKKRLAGKAIVVKNAGNAQHTRTGLEKLDEWLGNDEWDVIHFNWGLWDLAYRNFQSKNFGHLDKVDGELTTPLDEYEKNLRKLVARLKKTGATLIWANTTPVPEGEPGRIKGGAIKYNAVATKIMKEHGIAINDLHAEVICLGRPKRNNVHDTGDLSGKVAECILAALAENRDAASTADPSSSAGKSVRRLKEEFRALQFGMFICCKMATYKGVEWVKGYPGPALFHFCGRARVFRRYIREQEKAESGQNVLDLD